MYISLQQKARELRNNMPEPEKKLWFALLSRKQTEYKFLRQHPIGNYIPDFYCRKLQLIIEIDGNSHAFQEVYDEKRTEFFEKRELTVLRFWNNDVMNNCEGVCFQIISWIKEWEKKNK